MCVRQKKGGKKVIDYTFLGQAVLRIPSFTRRESLAKARKGFAKKGEVFHQDIKTKKKKPEKEKLSQGVGASEIPREKRRGGDGTNQSCMAVRKNRQKRESHNNGRRGKGRRNL